MNRRDLETPAFLLDLDVLEHNLRRYHQAARLHGKQIWPMVKTHKSTELARMQAEYGADGFLCGTLDECEALQRAGLDHLMYAYPVAGRAALARVVRLSKACDLILRLDCVESAALCQQAAEEGGTSLSYTVIVDSGLHRFGVAPEQTGAFVERLGAFPALRFRGISTHPGHVYGAAAPREVPRYAQDECRAIARAVRSLEERGLRPQIVSSGSTPTFFGAISDPNIQIYHPGNYLFHDAIQIANGTADESECALSVLTSVLSRPQPGRFLCDAGAKCLGLDQGAHAAASVRGFGRVMEHPELTVEGLSEEVGKLTSAAPEAVRVGELLRIIPNHACPAANMTDYLIGVRGDRVERLFRVDIRGNRTAKGAL